MNYYDPWAHVFWLFFNRSVAFFASSLALSLSLWSWLLHRYYGAEVPATFEAAWLILQGGQALEWRLLLGLTVATGTCATAVVFAGLMSLGRLRHGETHRRGARVVGDADRSA